jgi:hypothetical protein
MGQKCPYLMPVYFTGMADKFYESVPTFFRKRVAEFAVIRVESYFHVRLTIKTGTEGFGFSLEIPDEVKADKRAQIEAFIVAWGKGFEDGSVERSGRAGHTPRKV